MKKLIVRKARARKTKYFLFGYNIRITDIYLVLQYYDLGKDKRIEFIDKRCNGEEEAKAYIERGNFKGKNVFVSFSEPNKLNPEPAKMWLAKIEYIV